MTLGELLRRTTRRLGDAGRASAGLDARLLMEAATGLDTAALRAEEAEPVAPEAHSRLEVMVQRALGAEPMAYILGRQGFLDHLLHVGPGVLIPRPESEEVVGLLCDGAPDVRRVLDLGTGSGALLIALLDAFPDAHGVGVDLSAEALHYAARNLCETGHAARALLVRGDWTDSLVGTFERIVCNPPYITPSVIPTLGAGVRDHEPHLALDGGAEGLEAYRRLVPELPRLLSPGGRVALEIGHDQGEAVSMLVGRVPQLEDVHLHHDLAGHARAVSATRRS